MNAPFMTAVQVLAIEWRTPDALLTEPPGKAYPTDSLPATMRDAVRATARYVAAPEALAAQCFIAAGAYLAQMRVNAPQFRIEGFATGRAVHNPLGQHVVHRRRKEEGAAQPIGGAQQPRLEHVGIELALRQEVHQQAQYLGWI